MSVELWLVEGVAAGGGMKRFRIFGGGAIDDGANFRTVPLAIPCCPSRSGELPPAGPKGMRDGILEGLMVLAADLELAKWFLVRVPVSMGVFKRGINGS